jgi:hypothetical protein
MAFERTVRHVNEVKEECKPHSHGITDPVVSTTAASDVASVPEPAQPSTSTVQDAAAEAPIAQSAAEIAEAKKQEEIARKTKADMIQLMANQRKLERAKEKRENRYKDQLDSISVSDAEQRFAKVQLNKATNVSQNVHCTIYVEWSVSKC